jgi:hypothetical protein
MPAAQQPITTVVPAYATATIPIAFQTTRFAVGTESAFIGARSGAEISRNDIAEAVREGLQQEAARRQESARETAPKTDSCADLKNRLDQVEKRLEQVEKQVEGIAAKVNKLQQQ